MLMLNKAYNFCVKKKGVHGKEKYGFPSSNLSMLDQMTQTIAILSNTIKQVILLRAQRSHCVETWSRWLW